MGGVRLDELVGRDIIHRPGGRFHRRRCGDALGGGPEAKKPEDGNCAWCLGF